MERAVTVAPVDPPRPPTPVLRLPRVASVGGQRQPGERIVPEETAVAFSYNGSTHAVMMATPADLEDFAAGLSLTEGIVASVDDVSDLAVVHTELGTELRMWISDARLRPYAARRRHAAGPTGCGLCGIESLAEASRPARRVGEGLRL